MSTKKKRNKVPVSRAYGFQLIKLKLAMANRDPVPQDQHERLIIRPMATLARLKLYDIDEQDFVELNEANCAAFCLAGILYNSTKDEEARRQLGGLQPIFHEAALALHSLGDRYNVTKVYRAKGDELAALEASFGALDQIIPLATKGLVLQALVQAEDMVTQKLRELDRQNTKQKDVVK